MAETMGFPATANINQSYQAFVGITLDSKDKQLKGKLRDCRPDLPPLNIH